ncbi:ABC transporter substrate-binding protein [Alphaproteobacteria bacterium]|nr:ABC transporter substrate-binding protein [Alphaproteobacteria bacterium]
MKNYLLFFVTSSFLLLLNSCEKKETTEGLKDPIRIAAIEPLSGPYAAVGQDIIDSISYWADVINTNGGVLDGRMIEIVPMDNSMKAEKTTELLRKAIDEGIRFVTQGGGSSHALNIIKQLEKYNSRNPGKEILYLNNSAVTTSFTNENCTFFHFRFDSNVDMKVAGLVSHMSKDKEVKKVYLFNQNYVYGQTFRKTATKMISERASNIEIVGDELIQPFGKVQDFNPYVSKIKLSGADSILTGNWGPDAYRLVNALADAGVKVKLFGIYISQPTGLAAMGKNLLKNEVVVVKEFNPTNSKAPSWYKKLEEGHLEKKGFTPDADRFRFMLDMFKAAIESANSIEPKDIAYALEGIEGKSITGGKVIMRKKDHQIHFDMQALLVSEKVGQPLIYRNIESDMSYVNVGNIPVEDITLNSSCKMKRP